MPDKRGLHSRRLDELVYGKDIQQVQSINKPYGIAMSSDRRHIWYSQLGIGCFGSFNVGAQIVNLRGLPKGRFKVRITVTLADGRKVRTTRKYRTCAKRPSTPKKKGVRL